MNTQQPVHLYTFANSPFGAKVYWALIYKQIEFEITYVNPITTSEIRFSKQGIVPDVAAFLARRKIPALVVKARETESHGHDGEPIGVVEDILVNSHPVSKPVAGGIGERPAAFVYPRAGRLPADAQTCDRRHLQDRSRLVRQGLSERIVAAFPAGTNTCGEIVER